MSHDAVTPILLQRGRTARLDELPPRSIALDGFVQGPGIDTEHERYSFDHHAGCIRHATLSTAEMTLDALRVGLDPKGMTVYLNDLDPDSVMGAWLLTRPEAAHHPKVASAVRALGRLDALGPAGGGPGLVPALRWAMASLLDHMRQGTARTLGDTDYRALLDDTLARLDRWWDQGAPKRHETMPAPRKPAVQLEILRQGTGWVLADSPSGLSAFASLYRRGHRAAVIHRPLADGTHEYTVGKASEFVHGFPVPGILRALRDEEKRRDQTQSDAHNWGGGSTIGGSPRNADGSASQMPPDDVFAIVERVILEGRDGEA
jgi:hypothetical protein